MARSTLSWSGIGVGLAAVVIVTASLVAVLAGQTPGEPIPMDGDDIAGAVTGPDGPEAGSG